MIRKPFSTTFNEAGEEKIETHHGSLRRLYFADTIDYMFDLNRISD